LTEASGDVFSPSTGRRRWSTAWEKKYGEKDMKCEEIKKLSDAALSQLIQSLEEGKSEALQAYLGTMARFHTYGETFFWLRARGHRPRAWRVTTPGRSSIGMWKGWEGSFRRWCNSWVMHRFKPPWSTFNSRHKTSGSNTLARNVADNSARRFLDRLANRIVQILTQTRRLKPQK
jgi:hypothetical protein